jgi:hypothetical protein
MSLARIGSVIAASRVAAVSVIVLAISACGSRSTTPADPHEPRDPPPAERFTTTLRTAKPGAEQTLAARGIGFDPALDCVARAIAARAPAEPSAAQYRHAMPVRCGSPLYVVRALLIADDAALIAAVDTFEREVPSPAPLVLGVAEVRGRRAVAIARRLVELEPVARAGATRIAGKLLLAATSGQLLIATRRGVSVKPFEIRGGRFNVETGGERDATLELVFWAGSARGPFARLRIGEGITAFHGDGSLLNRINEARRSIGVQPLQRREQVGTCDHIPAQVDGIDVSDRAQCFDVPLLDLDDLAHEITYRPLLQDILLRPAASMIEIGAKHEPQRAIEVRVLIRFETMTPEVGRARVIELLQQRWPDLLERKLAGLQAVADTWSRDSDVFGSGAKYKPAADQLAARWTTRKHYYVALTTSRDLDTALGLVQPDDSPSAVDAAVVQVRGKDGAMLHVIAVALELP